MANDNFDEGEIQYNILLHHLTDFVGYWSGFDSSPYEMHGNSILIHLKNLEYIYVGRSIHKFTAVDKITDYISPVGNGDVPCPVAYGEENVYFMLDLEYMKKVDLVTKPTVANSQEIYCEYISIHPKPTSLKYVLEEEMLTARR
jgi:hypothetical protein